ncbi:MAG: hypothetical protein ACM3KR_04415 [Deltaproteobacteria bacterium]
MPCYKRVWGLICLALGIGMLLVVCLPKLGWVFCVGMLLIIFGWVWLIC